MGINCINCNKIESEATLTTTNEKEVKFPLYTSIGDNHLECLEKDNNLFRYATLVEYINLLSNFTLETANIPFDGFYLKFLIKIYL